MTDKLQAYAVALVLTDGRVTINALVAPTEAFAGAATVLSMPPSMPGVTLQSCAAVPLTLDFLRFAVRAMETGQTKSELVVIGGTDQQPEPPAVITDQPDGAA